MVAGYAGFFEKMAETAHRVLKDLRTVPHHHAAPPPLDNKALAHELANAVKNDPSFVNDLAAKIKKTP